jgi:hypothetical protein
MTKTASMQRFPRGKSQIVRACLWWMDVEKHTAHDMSCENVRMVLDPHMNMLLYIIAQQTIYRNSYHNISLKET